MTRRSAYLNVLVRYQDQTPCVSHSQDAHERFGLETKLLINQKAILHVQVLHAVNYNDSTELIL